jgi:hypothetical protein
MGMYAWRLRRASRPIGRVLCWHVPRCAPAGLLLTPIVIQRLHTVAALIEDCDHHGPLRCDVAERAAPAPGWISPSR